MKPTLIVLSGAGMSVESGISTFRDTDGLWENHDVMDVATPDGFARNPELVYRFYNDRRRQLFDVEPNAAHRALVTLENQYDVHIITQNVDDLHERAGSSNVMHLHGELRKARSSKNPTLVYPWEGDLSAKDICAEGSPLRPHIVWFGEDVPLLQDATKLVATADVVIIIGTSMNVYPAAGLIEFAPKKAVLYYVDPRPAQSDELNRRPTRKVLAMPATKGMKVICDELLTER